MKAAKLPAEDALGIGLVGTGFMARKHADALASHPRARLVQVWSTERSTDVASEFAREFNFGATTTDYESLLADPQVDVVFICSPDQTHADFVLEALVAGKHVFCEKPLAQRAADFEAIGTELATSGTSLAVGMNVRFRGAYAAVKEAIAGGELGPLRFIRGTYVVNVVESVRENAKPWWLQPPDGTHQFLHGGGTHIVDLVRWIGGSVRSVFARGAPGELAQEWPLDTFSVSLELASGAIGEVLVAASAFRPNDFSLECWLRDGSVVGDAVYRRAGDALAEPEPLDSEQRALDLVLQFDDLATAIDTGTQPGNSFEEALRNFRVIDAIEESLRTGEPVRLDPVA